MDAYAYIYSAIREFIALTKEEEQNYQKIKELCENKTRGKTKYEQALELHNKGLSFGEIAKTLNVSRTWAYQLVKNYNKGIEK